MNKIQKKKKLQEKFKSSCMCNGQISHVNSYAMDKLKDVSYKNGITCDNSYDLSHQNDLKIDKRITSQNKSIRANDSIPNLKYMANYQQIKPCFVKLNACAIQNYILNHDKIVENKQDILHNTKFLDINTSQTDKDISKIQNTISRSVSNEYNDFENFKRRSVKQCSVVLCDNIKDWYIKSKRNMKNTINIRNESNILHLVSHNLSESIPNCNKSIELAPYNTKKTKDLIKNSFVKVERIKVKEFIKKNSTKSHEKDQNIISSTPIGKRVKPFTSLVTLSPINSNIYDKLHWSQECSLITEKKDISNIEQKNSHSLITMSEYYKLDPTNVQEQQTKISLLSQKSQMSTNSIIENGLTSFKDNVNATETKYNVEMRIPYSSNISTVSTNQSRSLFDDTAYNHSAKGIEKNDMEERYFSDALGCKLVKINTVDSSINLHLEQKQLLNNSEQADTNSRYISPSKNLNNVIYMRQKYDNEFQENYSTRINTVETIHKNLKNEIVNINSILSESQENINVDAHVLFTRLQDPIRIGRRMQYPKWHLSMSSNISKSVNNKAAKLNNEIFCITTDKDFSNVPSAYNSEQSKNEINSSFDHSESFDDITEYNSTNKQTEKSIFLKPGKYWARSLSILNNINDESELDKLSIGKGKKWRHSVKNILDMQKQGNFLY